MVKTHHPLRFLGRFLFYAAGLVILCIGIILNTKTGLGVAPVNSLPYLCSEITPLSLGQTTTILYLICIAVQCILKRKLSLLVLLQFPLSYVFGLLVDFFNSLLDVVHPSSLPAALFWLAVAIACIALGVVMAVGMDLVPNPPDGMVQTLSQALGKEFGLTKNIFDLTMVSLSILGGLIFPHRIIGIGVGTVLSALLVGRLAALFRKLLSGIMSKLRGTDQ